MTKRDEKIRKIIMNVDNTLETAEFGLRLVINKDPRFKLPGLRNVVVFGRAVTNTLQHLRSVWRDFDKWYQKYVKEMSEDPLMKYFYDLRSEILKEGSLEVLVHVKIHKFNYPEDLTRIPPPPPTVKAFFIGDNIGGSGWIVRLHDGSEEKLYVNLPSDIAEVSLHFPSSPEYHLGRKLGDSSIESLCKLYIDYLKRMVSDAKKLIYEL